MSHEDTNMMAEANGASNTTAASSIADAAPVHRNFFDSYADEAAPAPSSASTAVTASSSATSKKLFEYIHQSVIGRTRCIDTPYGWRRSTYADYTASGKPLSFLEEYLQAEVLPVYANTHTLTSFTGLQTTLFRKEARDILQRNMRASKDDVVLFTGSGSTAALTMLIHVLNLRARIAAFHSSGHTGPALVVLLGPYEHHSNLLPWREAGAQIEWTKEDETRGGVDQEDLERQTKQIAEAHPHAIRIGAFSAASNVSGILTDSIAVSRTLKKWGFLSVWDYASAAPYVEVDANPRNDPALSKDAIIVSTHKFIGGPGSSGALLVKKKHLLNRTPSTPGGGTVFFVTDSAHRYLENAEEREEGGTPDILAGIRAGLAWHLKEQCGIRAIAEKEEQVARKAMARLMGMKNVVVMGNPAAPRLPIFSFLIRFTPPSSSASASAQQPAAETFLHSGFVAALLNDLFGVQSRSGCLCAGPYAQSLLGMSSSTQSRFEAALIEKYELLRPGFVRVNFNWFVPDEEVEYILRSIDFVSQHGWKFLPSYGFLVDSGEWKHRSRLRKSLVGRKWLANISYDGGSIDWRGKGVTRVEEKEETRSDSVVFAEYLSEADAALKKIEDASQSASAALSNASDHGLTLPASFSDLKWFLLPAEAQAWMKDPEAAREKHRGCTALQPARFGGGAGKASVQGEESKMDIAESSVPAASSAAASSTSAPSSTFSLIAPATASQTHVTTVGPPPAKGEVRARRAGAAAAAGGEQNPQQQNQKAGGKRSAEEMKGEHKDGNSHGQTKQQKQQQAKKQKKDAAATSADGDEPDKRRFVTDDLAPDVCKNCWHVHWNAATSANGAAPTEPAAAAAAASSSKPQSGTLTKECSSCPCINYVPSRSKSLKEIAKVGGKIQRLVGSAIKDYSMIRDGDRVLIGISGGKDSLTLFHILRNLQRKAPVRFTLGCVTVDPQTPEYDPSPLKAYFASMGVPYFYESIPILALAREKMDPKKQSICAFCSRMKRGVLYSCLRREGYNVLALGQHLDDLAESLLMSVFHNGLLRTMKANYHAEAGDIRIVRPLIYVRERLTREYSNIADLPVINESQSQRSSSRARRFFGPSADSLSLPFPRVQTVPPASKRRRSVNASSCCSRARSTCIRIYTPICSSQSSETSQCECTRQCSTIAHV
jgi:selenocysteine lyase/cysteine desulfurase